MLNRPDGYRVTKYPINLEVTQGMMSSESNDD